MESDQLAGYVDYLIAECQRFLALPMLCITEAKKDDIEQGLAQFFVNALAIRKTEKSTVR